MKKYKIYNLLCRVLLVVCSLLPSITAHSQINTETVINIGRNAMYFEDYVLSIQYFNQAIAAKPHLAMPYFYRAVAKLNLEDYKGAEEDCTLAIERNPFIVDAYQIRGIARQTLHKDKEAIKDYDAGLKQLPQDKVFLMNKAVCQVSLKDYDGAESTYSRLIKAYPSMDNAYLGRAQLLIAKGDTAKALPDIDKCISLNKNNSNAYVMRSDLRMRHSKDAQGALDDMNEAIKLEPHYAGYFINRAYLKYNLDNYSGAMSDYDYALSLEPTNMTAHYNRGLLRTEVGENNKAISDFSYVLRSDPNNMRALFNRAVLYAKTGQYKSAIKDYDALLQRYPNFQIAMFARADCRRMMGDRAGAERDYKQSHAKFKANHRKAGDPDFDKDEENGGQDLNTEAAVKNKFNTLLTVNNDNGIKPKYNNRTRGRVQDNNMQIENEPMFVLTYYVQGNGVHESAYYMREVNDINDTRMLPMVLHIANRTGKLAESDIEKHFASIEYYNGVLAAEKPRSVDYFARAMEFVQVKNPAAAIADLDRAIGQSDKFTLAYFARANAKFLKLELDAASGSETQDIANSESDAMLRSKKEAHTISEILADYDKVLSLSPKNVFAFFNKGNLYLRMGDLTSAISCYTSAIEIKADLGEAYYNRGLVYMKLGNTEKGVQDLSKAGELGILPSYNVLKRMTR